MTVAGVLEVEMVADARGRSRVQRLTQAYPQRVTTAAHADVDPRIAYLCVQNPSGGIFADDDLRTEVSTAAGSHLLFTSQAATQVFDGHVGPGARHLQRIRVCRDSVLEYLPREIIPQANSRFTQRTEIDVEHGGVFLGWEMLAAGRIGHGERYRYRSVECRTSVRVAKRVVARDAMHWHADTAPARLVGADYCATLLVVAPGSDHVELEYALRQSMEGCDATSGISVLPFDAGVIVRLVGGRAPALRSALKHLVGASRRTLLNLQPPPSRLI